MHTEANNKKKNFLAARALLKVKLVKIIGDDIAEKMAADQHDGAIAGMPCVQCIEWLECRYGTLSSRHVKTLTAALQTNYEKPANFPMHGERFNRPTRKLNRSQSRLDNAYTIVPISQILYQYLLE